MMVPIESIVIDQNRARKDFGDMKSHVESIGKRLLHPLVCSPLPEGKYKLIAGERRYRALFALGRKEVPITIFDNLSGLQQKEIELEENLRRQALSWQEECELISQIDEIKREIKGSGSQGKETDGWTIEKTADLVGQSKGTVSEKINLAKTLKERPDLKDAVKDLPLKAAKRVIEKRQEAERLERLAKGGNLFVSADIKHGDCRELIKQVPDNSVDLIITDPPFGNPEIALAEGTGGGERATYTAMLKPSDNLNQDAVKGLLNELVPQLYRVLKPGSHFYMFFAFDLYPHIISTLSQAGFETHPAPLIWDKGRPVSQFGGYNYTSSYEPILFGRKPGPVVRRLAEGIRNILQFPPVPVGERMHPFEKPGDLIKLFLKQSSTLNDMILDPFAGSGKTIKVARDFGRKALGFELDQDNFFRAQALLSKKGDDPTLFDGLKGE
jgi:ParB/RepB/Spo0J family partition protein